MTDDNTPPAGWHPDPERPGQQRYWNGSQWTEHRAPAAPAAPVPPAATQVTVTSVPTVTKTPWWKRHWVHIAAAALVAFGLGAAVGTTDPKSTSEYKAMEQKMADAEAAAAESKQAAEDAVAEKDEALGDLPKRETAVADKEKDLNAREATLKKAEASVSARERKVGIVERRIAANTIPGDGIFKVGTDMRPGTYRTTGSRGCYYAILNSTNTSDIANNNITDGPAFVTVSIGQYFNTTRCADWILQ